MVPKEKAVPCFSCQFFLPFDHDLLELFEIIPFCSPFAIITAIDFPHAQTGIPYSSSFPSSPAYFCASSIVTPEVSPTVITSYLGKHLPVHLLKIFMDSWSSAHCKQNLHKSVIRLSVRKCLILGDHADHIHTETIDSLSHQKFIISETSREPCRSPSSDPAASWKTVKIVHICLCVIFPG